MHEFLLPTYANMNIYICAYRYVYAFVLLDMRPYIYI